MSVKYYQVILHLNEEKYPEMIEHLKGMDNKTEYIMQLIEDDMVRRYMNHFMDIAQRMKEEAKHV